MASSVKTAEKRKSAIVVGSGIGGVATAALLAKAGVDVVVCEKNEFSGGRCSLIRNGQHRFDQGPSLLLLPHIFEDAFADLDTTLEAEGVALVKCEPNYVIHFADGETFTMSTDLTKMKPEVEKYEGKDAFKQYLGFLQEAHLHYELSVEHVLRRNFYSLFSMARPSFLRHVIILHPFTSIWSRVRHYFKTERLRRVFTFASMYMGMSPFEAPGTYSLLQYTELAEGIWYPIGGFHKVIEAMVNVGRRLGVSYRYSSPVSKVDYDGNRAIGVTLASGEQLTADVVIMNADLVYAHAELLAPSARTASLEARATSCSSISFYWSLNQVIPQFRAHNIFLADDYQPSFDQIFKDHAMPDDPSFYVNVPSRIDPTAAPEGMDSVVVLVPVGHLDDGKGKMPSKQNWPETVDRARRMVIATIEKRIGLSNFKDAIVHESVNTPLTWKDNFNLDRGAILGLSHDFFNVLSFRPATRHPKTANLFFVGASTHPGTGVPIVLAGAKLTAEQALDSLGVPYAWPTTAQRSANKRRYVSARMDAPESAWPTLLAFLFLLAGLAAIALGVVDVRRIVREAWPTLAEIWEGRD